jgi:MFS family permease
MVTAVMLAGVRSERTRGKLYLWLGVLSGLTPIGLALSPNLPLAVLSTAGMGLAQGGFMTLTHAMIQTMAPDAIRGRMMGVYSWHIQFFMASFNLVNGTLAGYTALTAPLVLGAGGVGFLIAVTLSMGRVPLRQLYSRGVPAT